MKPRAAARAGQGAHPPHGAASARATSSSPASYEGLAAARRDLLPQRPHLLLRRDDPAGGRASSTTRWRPGGYLFLGHAESLSRITDLFTPIRFQGAMVYQKPEAARERRGRPRQIRVLVVDDSAFVRQAADPHAGRRARHRGRGHGRGRPGRHREGARAPARRGDARRARCRAWAGSRPCERLMAELPVPVLLLSSLTTEGADVTLRGLELGALDFVDKSQRPGAHEPPEPGRGAAGEDPGPGRGPARAPAPRGAAPASRAGRCRARGAARADRGRDRHLDRRPPRAAGDHPAPARGPALPRCSSSSTCPWASRARWPSASTRAARCPCARPRTASWSLPGRVLIAPAGRHMKLRRARRRRCEVWLDDEPRGALHRPSADVLMASVAKVYGAPRAGRGPHRHGLGRRRGPARDPRGRAAAPWPRARRPA